MNVTEFGKYEFTLRRSIDMSDTLGMDFVELSRHDAAMLLLEIAALRARLHESRILCETQGS